MIRLLLSVFFLEVGLVLAVVPWSTYWERNYFAGVIPLLHGLMTNYFVRGAVSGLGLINIAAAVSEVVSLFAARRTDSRVMSIHQSSIVEE
jgi:hypothetical protein